MSKGSPIVPIRIPVDLVDQVEQTIQRRNFWTRNPPWTRTGFIIAAIKEKIDKMRRSRRKRA